jgi:RNA polymerase sigma-70 factor (ECF subfamily)
MSETSLLLDAQQAPAAPNLIARARDDVAAFGELYRRYYQLVFRYCRRRLFLRDAAEDLTAEVFLKAVEKFDRFRGDERAFRVWLYRLATNCANEHLRKRTRRQALREALVREQRVAQASDGDPPGELADQATNLKCALLRLSLRQQALIALRYFEDMAHAEISTVLGSSPATVRSQISRALARLRKMLAGGSYAQRGKA